MQIDLANLYQKRHAESRSLSAENFRAEKGKGGMATFENQPPPPFSQLTPVISARVGSSPHVWKSPPVIVSPSWITMAPRDPPYLGNPRSQMVP